MGMAIVKSDASLYNKCASTIIRYLSISLYISNHRQHQHPIQSRSTTLCQPCAGGDTKGSTAKMALQTLHCNAELRNSNKALS